QFHCFIPAESFDTQADGVVRYEGGRMAAENELGPPRGATETIRYPVFVRGARQIAGEFQGNRGIKRLPPAARPACNVIRVVIRAVATALWRGVIRGSALE